MLHEAGVKDRRVQKTKDLLHKALGSLIREKPYDAIVVQDILDRANVGRSTFYMHFRDKDELLVSSIHDLLRSVQARDLPSSGEPSERIIEFSLPIFEYIDHHRNTGSGRMGISGRAIIHERLQRVIEEVVAEDVRELLQSHRLNAPGMSPELLARYVASTFILVLNWWVESRSRLKSNEVDGIFRALALPVLVSISG